MDPIILFNQWLEEARQSEPDNHEAMALATVDEAGRPSVRIVLLKSIDDGAFTFHTNGESRKGGELDQQKVAALNFHWKSLARQVRVEGTVETAPARDSDAYFATRPRRSQIGAWASLQSRPLDQRETLLARMAEMETRFAGGDVPRPDYWHGYRVTPERIEFWEDGDNRLHHRRLFHAREDGSWDEELLYP